MTIEKVILGRLPGRLIPKTTIRQLSPRSAPYGIVMHDFEQIY